MTGQYSDGFRLSITKALSTQLYAALEVLNPAPLTVENLNALYAQATKLGLDSLSGVYQLYRQNPTGGHELTYVGKADQPLPKRLSEHLFKLSGRVGISIDEISFKCLFVEEDLSAVSPEKMLIKRHLETSAIVWNNRGFGINDPGRNRDGTVLKEDHFDLEYRIDLDREVVGLRAGAQSLRDLLQTVKSGVPYIFRYQRSASFKSIRVVVPSANMSVDAIFRFIAKHLDTGWKISALVGWTIMYQDKDRTYASAFRYYHSDGTVKDAIPRTKQAEEGDMTNQENEDDDESALF
ncbi:hypothetical protein [Nonomuraea bangladeshensis]|uniref:hypothetical protein n=1 Tax=Nonomuraea bangladeshensis TaxID=404385 RepID=UPI003C30B8C2